MQRKKLQKLQKHLRTLKLFKVKENNRFKMALPKKDNTRFAIFDYEFECGMPACVAGHAKYIFSWERSNGWDLTVKFHNFFDLNITQTEWITCTNSYKSLNPTPETAAKHIQDVLDGKI